MAAYKVVQFDQSPSLVFPVEGLVIPFVFTGHLYLPEGASIVESDSQDNVFPRILYSDLLTALSEIISSLLHIPSPSPDPLVLLFRKFYKQTSTHIEPTSGDMVQYYAYVEYSAPWTLRFGLRTDSNIPEFARVYAQILFPKEHVCNCNRDVEWLRFEK